MPQDAPHERPGIHDLPDELDKIRSYVEATNTHINHLESVAEDIIEEQIVDVKHALQDAHRGLERLEAQFAVVGEIKKEVWQTYRRLRVFEEKTREGEDISVRDLTRPRAGTIRVVPALQTPSVAGSVGRITGMETPMMEGQTFETPAAEKSEENWKVESTENWKSEGGSEMGAGVGGAEDKSSSNDPRSPTPTPLVDEQWQDAVVAAPRIVPISLPARSVSLHARPVSMPVRTHLGHSRVKSAQVPSSRAMPQLPVKPERLSWPHELKRTRREVIESIAREESRGGAGINDPKRKREGSADGTLISQAVMTADSNPLICVPHLAYIKIHEVRDLKAWLTNNRYLRESKRISRTEKVLHLLTVLQVGCRFESVAVLFSRRPKEVLSACREVFDGLLELHSETMLPDRSILERRYLYPNLWHMVHNYGVMEEKASSRVYLAWDKEDIRKVLVTLNIYVGRYRSQGHFALTGDILNWGKYIHVVPDEALFDVPRWIERLQTAPTPPPRATTRPRVTR